jgi:hypothetical protein
VARNLQYEIIPYRSPLSTFPVNRKDKEGAEHSIVEVEDKQKKNSNNICSYHILNEIKPQNYTAHFLFSKLVNGETMLNLFTLVFVENRLLYVMDNG